MRLLRKKYKADACARIWFGVIITRAAFCGPGATDSRKICRAYKVKAAIGDCMSGNRMETGMAAIEDHKTTNRLASCPPRFARYSVKKPPASSPAGAMINSIRALARTTFAYFP